MLCENRFPLPGSPSTCTLDTAIVPLPSIFLIIAQGANHFLSRNNVVGTRTPPPVKLHIFYLVLVGCQIAMTILELIRLVLEQFGVGLLPFNTIGLICAFVVLLRERKSGRTRQTLAILAVYWFFLIIFEAIKVARLQTLEELNPTTTKTSQYPQQRLAFGQCSNARLVFYSFLWRNREPDTLVSTAKEYGRCVQDAIQCITFCFRYFSIYNWAIGLFNEIPAVADAPSANITSCQPPNSWCVLLLVSVPFVRFANPVCPHSFHLSALVSTLAANTDTVLTVHHAVAQRPRVLAVWWSLDSRRRTHD
ncbi:hypothetical protein C8F04DRAFT_549139 [Mycena alexandri]|uniref:ABC transporter TMD0 domain-containing protein n=1 Tax=Mycena alexandri TaxID=1745969 RepID=A0AAD6X7J5_9AGAR|nr:hypothetical protein C8F04DRAFT_549139 [Mycena alexandri]